MSEMDINYTMETTSKYNKAQLVETSKTLKLLKTIEICKTVETIGICCAICCNLIYQDLVH